jgi:ankyrin repeat protein
VNAQSEGGETALTAAAHWGHSEVVQALVSAGADVNLPTDDGTTPLMYAACGKDEGSIRYLIDHGANVNATNDDGNNALITAIRWGVGLETLRYLASRVDDIKHRTNWGDTALSCAKALNLPEVEQLLREIERKEAMGSNLDVQPLSAPFNEKRCCSLRASLEQW